MSCGSSGGTIDSQTPFDFILGEKRRLRVNVYQQRDNAALEPCVNRSQIVVPPTITITNQTVGIYNCLDPATALISDVPAISNILDSNSVLIGYSISYVIDTTHPALNTVGDYMCVFTYTIDSIEIYKRIILFNIVAQDCATAGGGSSC